MRDRVYANLLLDGEGLGEFLRLKSRWESALELELNRSKEARGHFQVQGRGERRGTGGEGGGGLGEVLLFGGEGAKRGQEVGENSQERIRLLGLKEMREGRVGRGDDEDKGGRGRREDEG